jgi:hypothetical protein
MKVSIKSALAGVALALPAMTGALAGNINLPGTDTTFSNLKSGFQYVVTVNWYDTGFNPITFADTLSHTVSSWTLNANNIGILSGGGDGPTASSAHPALAKYTFTAASSNMHFHFLSTGNGASVFVTNANITAVPGPVAGSGLAALAMAGVGVLLARRRQSV